MKLSNVLDKKYSHTNSEVDKISSIKETYFVFHDLTIEESKLMNQFLTEAIQGKYDKDLGKFDEVDMEKTAESFGPDRDWETQNKFL